MRSGFSIFDSHTHIGAARHSGRRYTADELLLDMDRFGVDRSLVIPFPVVEDRREAHDEIGTAVLAHRDRLCGAACIDPFAPEQSVRAEMTRCRERFGFAAVKVQPQYQGLNPLSHDTDALFTIALENDLTVVWHTGTGVPYSLPSLLMLPARKHPRLRIVLSHCGGGLLVSEAIVAASFCPNIYLELSTLMPSQVQEVIANVPCDRLMIGSDLPENLEVEIGKILGMRVDEVQKRQILSETANAVFTSRSMS